MMRRRLNMARSKARKPDGFSLLELMAALAIAVAATLAALSTWSTRADLAGDRSCEAMRSALQPMVDQFEAENGRYPTRMQQIAGSDYWDDTIPNCPSSDRAFAVRDGQVRCPLHGQTGDR